MLQRTSYIKGKVIYKYRGRNFLDVPPDYMIKKMYYDSEENTTIVTLKKKSVLFEILCILLLIAFISIGVYNGNIEQKVYYDSTPTYYNGVLYLNIENDIESEYKVNISLYKSNGELLITNSLNAGDTWYTENIADIEETYILIFDYELPIGNKIDKCIISPQKAEYSYMEE